MSLQQTVSKGLRITKENLLLPLQMATWVIAIIAQRGSGKTYTAGDLIEEFWKNGIPFVVVDPLGIYWGLKYKQKTTILPDGKKKIEIVGKGLPILVFGGKNADRPLSIETIPALVETLVKTNLSCVLDVSEFSNYKDLQIVTVFLNTLFKENGKADRQVILEEADLFCSETPTYPAEVDCRFAVNNFVVRGGNNNLGCTLITQRSASVAKKTLTQADCLFILRTTAPQDVKVIRDWVEKKKGKNDPKIEKILENLDRLDNGEGYIYKPTKPDPIILEHVHFRERETLHATRDWKKQETLEEIPVLDQQEQLAEFDKIFGEKTKAGPYDLFTVPQLKKFLIERDSKLALLGPEIEKLKRDLEQAKSQRWVPVTQKPAPSSEDLQRFKSGAFNMEEIAILQDLIKYHFTDSEVTILKEVAALANEKRGPFDPALGAGERGTLNFKIGTFDVNATKIPEPPKDYTTENHEGRVLWVLLSKFGGKSTEYKDVREEVNKTWKLAPYDLTTAKKKLANDLVIFDDGAHIRANFDVGTIRVDGEVLKRGKED